MPISSWKIERLVVGQHNKVLDTVARQKSVLYFTNSIIYYYIYYYAPYSVSSNFW